MTYRFCGSEAEIFGVASLRRLGQTVELTEEQYQEAVIGGCQLLPSEDFEAIGFTQAEMASYAGPHARVSMPTEVQEKFKAAWIKIAEIKSSFEQGA